MVKLLRFTNIILAALLAGTSFGICIGFNPIGLSSGAFLEQQQNMLKSLNSTMISFVLAATIITLASAYIERKNKISFYTLLIATICFLSCILISRFGNSPIQNEMLTWKVGTIPSNWTVLRDQWWRFHILRTIAELIALLLISWVQIKD